MKLRDIMNESKYHLGETLKHGKVELIDYSTNQPVPGNLKITSMFKGIPSEIGEYYIGIAWTIQIPNFPPQKPGTKFKLLQKWAKIEGDVEFISIKGKSLYNFKEVF